MRPGGGPGARLSLALCAAGLVLFNFPLLTVWDRDATVFGLPLLPVALFGIWFLLIVALALLADSRRPPAAPGPDGPPP